MRGLHELDSAFDFMHSNGEEKSSVHRQLAPENIGNVQSTEIATSILLLAPKQKTSGFQHGSLCHFVSHHV